MNSILFLLLLLLLVMLWQDGLRSREFTVDFCKRKCNELDLQLLDQTVALKSLTLQRNENGFLRIFRQYNFEFSTNGVDRHSGTILINKEKVESFQLDHPDGTLILQEDNLIKPH